MSEAEFPPPEKNKPPGRPSVSFTPDDRALAATMAREGRDDATIAAALHVSLPTLQKHLADELAAVRAEAQPALFDAPPAPADAPAAPAPRRAGRKRYVPSLADREKVRLWEAARTPHAVQANMLGITEPTLRRAFAKDLEFAREKVRAETLALLQREAKAGSVPAIKALREAIDDAALRDLEAAAPAPVKEKPERQSLGKKAIEAERAAEVASGGRIARILQEARKLNS